MAARLNVVRSYISQIETGATQCREDFAARLDEALGTGTEILAKWKEHIAPLLEEPAYPQYFANFEKAEEGDNCVEVAGLRGLVAIRDSKILAVPFSSLPARHCVMH